MEDDPVDGSHDPRDIIAIGCSAGGVEALPGLLQSMGTISHASVTIVQHMAATEKSYLVEILARSTAMPVVWAEQGMLLQPGKVYVGPPDVHTLFADEHFRLARTTRENHARPSIDKLFRSAASQHGSRVIGVLLTGMLEDGVGGLVSIRDAGGVVIVQDPEDAAFPELPRRALLALEPDRVLPLYGIGQALQTLVGQRVPKKRALPEVILEAEIDRIGQVSPVTLDRMGNQTPIPCPDCKGPTWLLGDERSRRYRCYHGHVNSARDLLEAEGREVASALWSAVRALSDRAATLETLASDSDRLGRTQTSYTYAARAREARAHAVLARQFVLDVLKEAGD